MSKQPLRLLMCRATEFDVKFEINPWMNTSHQPSRDQAVKQQQAIIETLKQLGHSIEFVDPGPDCPDMCFSANAGVVLGNKVLLANLPAERQPEVPHFKAWFESYGFATKTTGNRFGGGGDALWVGDTLLAGYADKSRRASDIEVHQELRDYFDVEVLSIHSTDARFYDLDMYVGVLTPNLLAVCSDVLDEASLKQLQNLVGVDILNVALPDALGFGCNLVSDGQNVLISDRAPGLIKQLVQAGLTPLPHSIGQFMLSGGGIRCLSLNLPLSN